MVICSRDFWVAYCVHQQQSMVQQQMNTTTQFFTVNHVIEGLNQFVKVSFGHDSVVNHVVIALQGQNGGMAHLSVLNQAGASENVVLDSLVDMDEMQDASVDVDEQYCEIEFGAFSVIIHVDEEVSIDVLCANGDEFDVMESKSVLAMQLQAMLSGAVAA